MWKFFYEEKVSQILRGNLEKVTLKLSPVNDFGYRLRMLESDYEMPYLLVVGLMKRLFLDIADTAIATQDLAHR